MDLSHGIARTIFAALKNFAEQSGHNNLSDSKLILLGFSGTGVLFARFVAYSPDRVVAAILTALGHGDPFGIEKVDLPDDALHVPELIVVGGSDDHVGTQRPYEYFLRHWKRGAPWIFLVQNNIPHCCVINVEPPMLEWLDEVIKLQKPTANKPLRQISLERCVGVIRHCNLASDDHWGESLWNVCSASVQTAGRKPRNDFQIA